MAVAISIIAIAIVAGLCIVLQRRSSGAGPADRDVEYIRPHEGGSHQGRSPGADGGGLSYYNGS